MKTNYLLPNKFKNTGWILFTIGILLGLFYIITKQDEPKFLNAPVFAIVATPLMKDSHFFFMTESNLLDEIVGLLVIIGGLFIAFSKEKSEDEYISKIRLESLLWATYTNYIILILSIIFVYDFAFLWIMQFNIVTTLIFFVIRFNWALKRSKKQLIYEE